jgi:hypothetical protein
MELGKLKETFRNKYPKRKKSLEVVLSAELIQQFDEHQRTYVKKRKTWQGRKKPSTEDHQQATFEEMVAEKPVFSFMPLVEEMTEEQEELTETQARRLDHDNTYYKQGLFPDGWFQRDSHKKRSFAKTYRYCVYCSKRLEGKWHEDHQEECEGPKPKDLVMFCNYCCEEFKVFDTVHRCWEKKYHPSPPMPLSLIEDKKSPEYAKAKQALADHRIQEQWLEAIEIALL